MSEWTGPKRDYGPKGCCQGTMLFGIVGVAFGWLVGVKAAKLWATRNK